MKNAEAATAFWLMSLKNALRGKLMRLAPVNTKDSRPKKNEASLASTFTPWAFMDPKTKYKTALIVFYKGKVSGTVGAWNKPGPSLETTKTVLKHMLTKLP